MEQVMLCYRRRSVVKEASHLISPERQKAAVEALLNTYQLEWYEDLDAHNSARTSDRPGWQRLLGELRRPEVVGIAAYDLSRIYRNVRGFLDLVEVLNRETKNLVTVKERIDTTSVTGRAILTILMTIYQLEAELAGERMAANIDYKRRVLGRHWGVVPFGCLRNPEGHLIPDPETQATLIHAYELFATGDYTYDRLTTTLNTEGYTFRTRAHTWRDWNRDDVRRILMAWQLYQGDLPLKRQKDSTPADIIRGTHAPIVPVELCSQVAVELSQRGKRFHKQQHNSYMLTGLLFCGECGSKLGGYADEYGVRYYRHTHAKQGCTQRWVEAADAEAQVIGPLQQLPYAAICETLRQTTTVDPALSAALCEQIAETAAQGDRANLLFVEGHITYAVYMQMLGQLETRQQELQTQLGQTSYAIEELLQRFGTILTRFTGTLTQQRESVHSLCSRLVVREGRVSDFTPTEWLQPLWSAIAPHLAQLGLYPASMR